MVKNAIEVLIQRLDAIDAERDAKILPRNAAELYEACLTVVMRLVFVLCAEQRGLLLLGDSVYDQFYAASTLRDTLRQTVDRHGENFLEHRFDAWPRLLSLFRMIYCGCETDTFRLPVLNGVLFDPDRFPFLEGRKPGTSWRTEPCRPLPIDDRCVLHLMTAFESHGFACEISEQNFYRTLDVERIGHVYEDLLEYTVQRLDTITLGFEGTKAAKNPNISLTELESAAQDGENSLIALIRRYTHKNESTIRQTLSEPSPLPQTQLDLRVKPYVNLLRRNVLGYPVIYDEGSHVIVLGSDRRETGAHYTPKSLAEEIVKATLEPLVYEGFSDGKPLEDCRLKRPDEILSLKICDPAMGSGVFLISACRWLGVRLLESWENEEKNSISINRQERLREAMRLVAERCLYGVDINPLAVELGKISIWLAIQSKKMSFESLGHHFRCGDSLSGPYPLDQQTKQNRTFDFVREFKIETSENLLQNCKTRPMTFSWRKEFPDVFVQNSEQAGFDAVIGNPPFLGGRKMRATFGEDYLNRLLFLWPHASLNSDLCAFFFLRAATLLRKGGLLGFLATNTIGQGDTARTGLRFLIETKNFTIPHARSAFPWPGKATVVAASVVLYNGTWPGACFLDGRRVDRITAILDDGGHWGDARVFDENVKINFQGSVFAGKGFVLTEEEAEMFLSVRKENEQVVFPFLGGNDVNTSPVFKASRWAVDFRDFPLERCEKEWPELLERIRRLVKPERDQARRKTHKKFWWHHGDKRPALYNRIRKNKFVFVLVRHTKHLALARVSTQQVFQESLCILDLPNWTGFAVIQSTLHYLWARRGSSTLGAGLRYTPSDYFDTFPFLHLNSAALETLGEKYYNHRTKTMHELKKGLTAVYNGFHAPEKNDKRIVELRDLHRQMDETVAAAYGWDDLNLEHDFYPVDYLPDGDRIRYTVGEKARVEILRRLAELNRKLS